jgi:hypothetical protein
VLGLGILGVLLVVQVSGALAQPVSPTIVLGTGAAPPGERITVTFDGWEANSATLSVCGNRAARGSGDCDMVQSQGVRLRHTDETMVHQMTVTAPPFPCPCVIRAVGVETGELAVVPFEVVGHPVGPVIEPSELGQAVDVQIDPVDQTDGFVGWLRASLGGPARYLVSVTVKNLTTETWENVDVAGAVGRSSVDQRASFAMEVPELGPSATWSGEVSVEVPPPAVGSYEWRATATGAGPSVTAEATTRHVPWLLLLLVVVLVADLVFIVARWLRRRAQRREDELLAAADGEGGENGPPSPDLSTLPPPPVLVS